MTGFIKSVLHAEEIEVAIGEAHELVKRSQSGPLVLVGGIAMGVHGFSIFTKDVDFISRSIPSGFTVQRRLSFGGGSGKLDKCGVPVCFIVRDDDYKKLYEEARRKAVPLSGTRIKIITPEHLSVLKLVAKREKDEEDLKKLIRMKKINLRETRDIIKRQISRYALDDFNSYVEEVEWRRVSDRNK